MDKTQKYDRQLRLWQASGQAALESSKVCLINGTVTGCEVLKNLVLPGIGSFTVVDAKIVDGADIGNNFFLDAKSIDKQRAERVTHFLQELNDDVKGSYLAEDPVDIINTNTDYFLQFSLVITTDLHEKPLLKLADTLWKARIPLVVVRTVGFTGYARIVLPEHTIVETHPENVHDLRLDVPFPELAKYVRSIDFDDIDSMEHAHIPYIVVLSRYLDQWRQEHDDRLPSTSAEKNAFKQSISKGKKTPDEENFDEALAAVWKACTPTKIPSSTQRVFEDPACESITKQSSSFWIIARAIREFVENEGNGLLPLAGSLPDMKADTKRYVELQTIYRKKAKDDVAAVQERVSEILSSIPQPADYISNEEIESFCKHAAFVQVIRYRSLQEEYITDPKRSSIANWLGDADNNIVHYVMIRAIDRFFESHQHYPDAATLEPADSTEFNLLKDSVTSLLAEWDIPSSPNHIDDFIHETCRAGGSELPNVAALLGGLVAQEVIKLITQQYIPINNTVVYEGIKSTTTTYVL